MVNRSYAPHECGKSVCDKCKIRVGPNHKCNWYLPTEKGIEMKKKEQEEYRIAVGLKWVKNKNINNTFRLTISRVSRLVWTPRADSNTSRRINPA